MRFNREKPGFDTLLPNLKRGSIRKPQKIKLLCSKRALLKDNTFYNIQVQRNKANKHIYLIAQNESEAIKDDDYYIDLPLKEAKLVSKIFNKNYESIIDSISIQNEKLVLLNPHYVDTKSRNSDQLGMMSANAAVNNTIG